MRRRHPIRTAVLAATAYTVGLLFLLPYVEIFLTAGRSPQDLLKPELIPSHFSFSNFTTLWSAGGLGRNITVSLEIAFGATILVLLVAIPAAYYTARNRFRGRGAFLLLVLATQMFQPAAMLVGLQREFSNFSWSTPTISLIVINAGFNLAFAVWILNAFFDSIPVELEEAARVDGLSKLGALFRITLPLAAPGIVTALIFTFVSAWNEFLVALTLSLGSQNKPLPVAIDGYVGAYSTDWGHLFAAGVVATVPVILLFIVIERRVVSGLTAGAVK